MLVHSDDLAPQTFFAALERRLSKQAFETWFRPLRVTPSRAEGVLTIAVPNSAVRDWILSQYATVLSESLSELKLANCRIEWATPQPERAARRSEPSREEGSSVTTSGPPKPVIGTETAEA